MATSSKNANPPGAIYESLLGQILLGRLAEGDELPAIRRFSTGSAARGTVQGAYRRLQEDGFAEARDGGGKKIRPGRQLPPEVLEALNNLLNVALDNEVPVRHIIVALRSAAQDATEEMFDDPRPWRNVSWMAGADEAVPPHTDADVPPAEHADSAPPKERSPEADGLVPRTLFVDADVLSVDSVAKTETPPFDYWHSIPTIVARGHHDN